MEIRKIDDGVSVGPQITPDEVADLKAAGFASIIVNRPDGEASDQPDFAETATAAREHGMVARHIPVVSGSGPTDEHVAAFRTALAELPGPVYAHCRSGTRSATLWALSQAGDRPAGVIVEMAGRAGYDLSGLLPRLQERVG